MFERRHKFTTCSIKRDFPLEKYRPLVGEGWVAAGPLRGLFLQGHTHAWSEAAAHGDCICAASLLWLHTADPVGPCASGTLMKSVPSKEENSLYLRKLKQKRNHQNEFSRFPPPPRRIGPFSSGSLWSLKVIMSGSLQCRHAHKEAPTFPHTCFDMQIAMREIWKHPCPLLTNTKYTLVYSHPRTPREEPHKWARLWTFLHKHSSLYLKACSALFTHMKTLLLIHPRYLDLKYSRFLMQCARYIMHGLSLSQRSFTPCCASPPTAPRRQADVHTHTPCVLC